MAEKIDTQNLVLHGVGQAYLLGADGKVTTKLGSLQTMDIEISSTNTDVYGGDSLFPIFNFIKEKSATFKFKNACFDLNVVAAANGVSVATGGVAFGHEEFTMSSATYTLAVTTGVDVDSVVLTTADGTVLTKVAASPTATNTYMVSDKGVVTVSTGLQAASLICDYVYTSENGATVDVLTTSVPGYVELRHTSFPVEMNNGKKAVLSTRIYKARCDGALKLDYSRGEAVAPELTFKSVDPKRTDKKFVSYSVTYVA